MNTVSLQTEAFDQKNQFGQYNSMLYINVREEKHTIGQYFYYSI